MVFKPKLNEYNINTLLALANNSTDEFTKNKIKMVIIEKILDYNQPIFYLIYKFRNASGILKDAYADAILMNMKGNDYYIDDKLVDKILKHASFDALMYYGADSDLQDFNRKCKDEFYRRGYEIEDKIELERKVDCSKKLIRNLSIKKKGDRYDKY